MDIEIRKLTPDLAEDYVNFFDVTPHYENKDEDKCYCVTWRSDDSYMGSDHWYDSREERRERAFNFVRNGSIQGYLAYYNNKIVGWCNATADCRSGVEHLRYYWPIGDSSLSEKVKSVFCFMIAPEMQRKGVATKLLEQICSDAAEEGFDFVEAYVSEIHLDLDFRGHREMYEKCGFIKCAEREGKTVMRKGLKQ